MVAFALPVIIEFSDKQRSRHRVAVPSIGLICNEKFSGAIFRITEENVKLGGPDDVARGKGGKNIVPWPRTLAEPSILRRLTQPSIYLEAVLAGSVHKRAMKKMSHQ
jgi:hypothetical protein